MQGMLLISNIEWESQNPQKSYSLQNQRQMQLSEISTEY